VLLLLAALAVSAFPQGSTDTAGAQELLALINQERAKQGAAAVVLDDRLTVAAQKHSQLMAQSDTLTHQFDSEPPLTVRLIDQSVRSDHDAENIAMGADLSEIHLHLMQSPPHRANILNPLFDSVGIGIVSDGDMMYVTEDFAHALPVYSAMEADAAAQQTIAQYARSQRLPIPSRKPHVDLSKFACDMARDDKLDVGKAQAVAGARSGMAWTAPDLTQLPAGVKKTLSQPMLSGYALGVCFAPSATYPSGVYWLVMVIY
jgi:cysteine-rich secretory family protein